LRHPPPNQTPIRGRPQSEVWRTSTPRGPLPLHLMLTVLAHTSFLIRQFVFGHKPHTKPPRPFLEVIFHCATPTALSTLCPGFPSPPVASGKPPPSQNRQLFHIILISPDHECFRLMLAPRQWRLISPFVPCSLRRISLRSEAVFNAVAITFSDSG